MGLCTWYSRKRDDSLRPFTYKDLIKDDDVSILDTHKSSSKTSEFYEQFIGDKNVASIIGSWSNLSDKLDPEFHDASARIRRNTTAILTNTGSMCLENM